MSFDPGVDDGLQPELISRSETGVRLLITLLFFLIARVAGSVVALIAVYELVFTLITQRESGGDVRRFANHAISYLVAIGRYVTYNEEDAPFPFRAFPPELDLTIPAAGGPGEV